MKSLEYFMELLNLKTQENWSRELFDIAQGMGFDRTLLAIVPKPGMKLEQAFVCSNYADEWRSKYNNGSFAYIDPTVKHCIARVTPLAWSPDVFCSQQQKQMYEEASAYGLRSGVTLPVHGPKNELGMLCFVSDVCPDQNFVRHLKQVVPQLSLLRDIVLESAMRFAAPDNLELTLPSLTPRERECLQWTAAGKSTWEISKILVCSEAVVNFHIKNVRQKLDVGTRREAVVKAIRLGIISLS